MYQVPGALSHSEIAVSILQQWVSAGVQELLDEVEGPGTLGLIAIGRHELLQNETHLSCCRSVDATSGAEMWNVSYGRVTPLLEGVAQAPAAWTGPLGQGA